MAWPITAADLRNDLRQTPSGGSSVSDADAAAFTASAMSRVEVEVGPRRGQVLRTVVRARRAVDELVLGHAAGEVASVTVDGVELVGWSFDAEESPRLVVGPIPAGRVVVSYVAPSSVPPDVERAAIMLAAHQWMQARAGFGQPGDIGSPLGYALPNRVAHLLAPYTELT